MLNVEELERYQKHMILNEVGYTGQKRLKQAKVLCVGAGGLGTPLCLYLCALGIGVLGIADGDKVTRSNLPRQILYRSAECGQHKAVLAQQYLQSINEYCDIRIHSEFLRKDNAATLIEQYDIVVDCSDNAETRYLVNDTCCALNKPNVFASIKQFLGHCTVFPGKQGPCYRCLFDNINDDATANCASAGVLATTAGVMGLLQANEVVKLILEIGEPLINKFLIFDALSATTRTIQLYRSLDCSTCFDA